MCFQRFKNYGAKKKKFRNRKLLSYNKIINLVEILNKNDRITILTRMHLTNLFSKYNVIKIEIY